MCHIWLIQCISIDSIIILIFQVSNLLEELKSDPHMGLFYKLVNEIALNVGKSQCASVLQLKLCIM